MSKKKVSKKSQLNVFTWLAIGISLGSGLLLGYSAQPKPKLTPEICASRIQAVGGPQYAIDYVCNGKTITFQP